MSITEEERETLIKYRTEQAYEAIEDVEFLIDNDRLKLAVNRIYYGMFYILSALALRHQFKSSKHMSLIGWFNKTFIKEKIIDQKYGKIVRNAFKRRSVGDYDAFVQFEKADTIQMLENMKDFIDTIEEHVKK